MDIGAQLRTSREAKGLSLEALARATRVQPRILAAIERNDLTAIPPRPSGRSFVRAYAQEVDLDPERTARDYFARFAAVPDSLIAYAAPPARVRRIRPVAIPRWVSAAAGLGLLVAVLTGAIVRTRGPERRNESTPIGTSGRTAASHVVPAAAAVIPAAATEPAIAEPAPMMTIVLISKGTCWVTADADGKRILYKLLRPGSRETLQGSAMIDLRAGDAGALSWIINGREMGMLGDPGEVRRVKITPQNALTIR